MSQRIGFWDVLKGAGILLMILGHGLFTAGLTSSSLFKFIVSINMPLFMVVSGYFFYSTVNKYPIRDIVVKRSIELALPVILFATIHWGVFYFSTEYSLLENCVNWWARCQRTLWFFQALFLLSMIVLLAETILKEHAIWFYVLLFVVFLIIPDYANQEGTKAMLPFFIFGWYLNKNGLQPNNPRISSTTVIIVSGIVYCICMLFFSYDASFYISKVYIFSGRESASTLLWYNVLRTLTGISGIVFLFSGYNTIQNRLPDNAIRRWLSSVGKRTAWLYVVSFYIWRVLDSFSWDRFSLNPFILAFLLGILMFLVSWPVAVIADYLWNKCIERPLLNLYSQNCGQGRRK